MAKALVTAESVQKQTLPLPPVTADEIDPEAMAEVVRRVEQLRGGERKLYSTEEAMQALCLDLERIRELLDELP